MQDDKKEIHLPQGIFKIDQKLPEINKEVIIFNASLGNFFQAKLQIYDDQNSHVINDGTFKNGDIFWFVSDFRDFTIGKDSRVTDILGWVTCKTCPYWTLKGNIIKLLFEQSQNAENKQNKFQLMDFES